MHINNIQFNRSLQNNIEKLTTSTERLSTGKRINHAKDDSAGLQVSTRLTSQVRGTSQSIKNIKDGISVLQTADGGLATIQDMLQRVRELSIQGKNGTYSPEQKASIESEMKELISGINNISKNTTFNGLPLLNDLSVNLSGQNIDNQRVRIDNIPVNTSPGAKTTVEFWMRWNGSNEAMPFGWNNNYDILLRTGSIGINTANGNVLGVSSDGLEDKWVHIAMSFINGVPNEDNVEMYVNGQKQDITDMRNPTLSARTVSSTIYLGGWGTDSEHDYGGQIDELKIWDGTRTEEQIKNDMYATNSGTENGLLGYWKFDGAALEDQTPNGNNAQLLNGASFSEGVSRPINIHTGYESTNEDNINLMSVTEDTLNLANISLDDPDLIEKIDSAINAVSIQRGEIGAKINRYEFKVNNQENLINNTEATQMRIEDLDMSSEMSELTKTEIQMKTTQQMLKVNNSMYEQKMQMLFN